MAAVEGDLCPLTVQARDWLKHTKAKQWWLISGKRYQCSFYAAPFVQKSTLMVLAHAWPVSDLSPAGC